MTPPTCTGRQPDHASAMRFGPVGRLTRPTLHAVPATRIRDAGSLGHAGPDLVELQPDAARAGAAVLQGLARVLCSAPTGEGLTVVALGWSQVACCRRGTGPQRT